MLAIYYPCFLFGAATYREVTFDQVLPAALLGTIIIVAGTQPFIESAMEIQNLVISITRIHDYSQL